MRSFVPNSLWRVFRYLIYLFRGVDQGLVLVGWRASLCICCCCRFQLRSARFTDFSALVRVATSHLILDACHGNDLNSGIHSFQNLLCFALRAVMQRHQSNDSTSSEKLHIVCIHPVPLVGIVAFPMLLICHRIYTTRKPFGLQGKLSGRSPSTQGDAW